MAISVKNKNIRAYDKIIREIDAILLDKRVSYAQFSFEFGMPAVAFYNRYRVYGFSMDDR